MRAEATVTYKIDAFLEMRRNFEAYSVFYSQFLPCIVGKNNFKKLLPQITDSEDIATVSDEALALVGIENSCQRWDKIFENSEGQIRKFTKNEDFPEEWLEDVPLPEYTKTARNDPEIEKDTDNKTWSDSGIKRFNEICKMVIADRAMYPEFQGRWLKLMRNTKIKGRGIAANRMDCVDADDDLFSDTKAAPEVGTVAKNTAGVESDDELILNSDASNSLINNEDSGTEDDE